MSALSFSHACREKCGACCIAPTISSFIPGMPDGKPAGVRCVNLDDEFLCRVFDHPLRPSVCKSFGPYTEICGFTREEAMNNISKLETQTS